MSQVESTAPEPATPPWRDRLRTLARRSALALADTIVPPVCVACRQPLHGHDALCPACWADIDFIRPPLCDRLGIPLPFDPGGPAVSAAAEAAPPEYDRARAVARYDRTMARLIRDFKFHDRQDHVHLFCRWMANAGAELLGGAELLVPVPLHRWRLIGRRFNQSALLARALSRQTGLPFDPLALHRVRRTRPQVGLGQSERRGNVRGAFAVLERHRGAIAGRRVVLIDDVVTTGATVEAAARALRSAGAANVDVLALALVTDPVRPSL
jgi:ComF family protein